MDGGLDIMAYLPKNPPKKTTKPFDGVMNPFYSSTAWRRLRAAYKQQNPLCTVCFRKGIYKPATVVDHIIPIKAGGEPLDWDNLQSLCTHHHNSKSGKEGKENTSLTNMEKR
jgi:5-methylcytosine-specific restriction protein A